MTMEKSINSLLFLGSPCVDCYLIYLHKRSHHLVTWTRGFEEVAQIVCMKICKTFKSYQFAGLGLQFYYQVAPSQVFRKGKGFRLHSFLRTCRATTFRNRFTWLLLRASLTYLPERETAAQQTVACPRSKIQKLDSLWNMYKVYNKVNGVRLIV